jgi:hypothetical protein
MKFGQYSEWIFKFSKGIESFVKVLITMYLTNTARKNLRFQNTVQWHVLFPIAISFVCHTGEGRQRGMGLLVKILNLHFSQTSPSFLCILLDL